MLAEFAEVVFGFGDAIAICEENFSGVYFHRAFFVCHAVEEADDGASGFEAADLSVVADQNWGQVAAVAVGETAGASVVDADEERGVFLCGSAVVELVIEQAEQGSGRDFDALREGGHDAA